MLNKKNILLVEEDAMVRQTLGQALASDDYQVVLAANQHEALSEFGKQPIHVLLLDLNPRHDDAWATARSLTALQPRLPVIAMTTQPERNDHRSHSRKCHALIEKPFELQCLVQLLQNLA